MKQKTEEWLDSIETRRDVYIRRVNNLDKWFNKFNNKERERLIKEIEDPRELSIYGLDSITSKIIVTYIYSENRNNIRLLQKEMYDQFPTMTKKELTPYLIQSLHPLHYMGRAYNMLMSKIFEKRVDEIETSIGDIRNVNYKYLQQISNSEIALEIQKRAHLKGICLDGEIPDDLISLNDFLPSNLSNMLSCITTKDTKPLYSCLSDFTTKFSSYEEIEKEMQKLSGIGPKKVKQIVAAVENTGSKFADRKDKILEYKLQIGKK